jgi:hypothetical protein
MRTTSRWVLIGYVMALNFNALGYAFAQDTDRAFSRIAVGMIIMTLLYVGGKND